MKQRTKAPVEKNEELTVEIEGLSSEGAGVARYHGMAIFVPYTAPGDRIRCRVIKVQKNFAVGKLLQIARPSPDRVDPLCPVYGKCGGCVSRHMTYQAECRAKYQKVADALQRIGGLEIVPEPIVPSEQADRYRNKAQFPVGRTQQGVQIGFYAPRSHRIVDCRDCALQPPEFAQAVEVLAQWMDTYEVSAYDETTGKGLIRHLYLRRAAATGEMLVYVVANGDRLPEESELISGFRALPGVVGVAVNVNRAATNVVLGQTIRMLWGREYIEDILCGVRFIISPHSFYQVNSPQAQRLYNIAREFAQAGPDTVVLDLYCGAGTIGLTMADGVKEVIGVEVVPQAVEDARRNAQRNGITNARFLCADAAQAAAELAREGVRPDVILVDPPRKGCDAQVLQIVAEQMQPQRLVYISCDPATLARDAAALRQYGYHACRAVPVDLFARTAHVETVVLFSRGAPHSI